MTKTNKWYVIKVDDRYVHDITLDIENTRFEIEGTVDKDDIKHARLFDSEGRKIKLLGLGLISDKNTTIQSFSVDVSTEIVDKSDDYVFQCETKDGKKIYFSRFHKEQGIGMTKPELEQDIALAQAMVCDETQIIALQNLFADMESKDMLNDDLQGATWTAIPVKKTFENIKEI